MITIILVNQLKPSFRAAPPSFSFGIKACAFVLDIKGNKLIPDSKRGSWSEDGAYIKCNTHTRTQLCPTAPWPAVSALQKLPCCCQVTSRKQRKQRKIQITDSVHTIDKISGPAGRALWQNVFSFSCYMNKKSILHLADCVSQIL